MERSKKIFITGGTGLVGTSITEKLASLYYVSALYRERKIPIDNVEWIKYDVLTDPIENLSNVLKDVDVIIHCLASLKIGITEKEIKEIKRINITFTKKIVDEAVKYKIKKIIFFSTLSSIKKPLPKLITEKSKIDLLSFYSESKFMGEQIIQNYSEIHNINYTILRISSPISTNLDLMHDTVVKKWIVQSINKENISIFGKGSRKQDFIFVSDIANLIVNCINNNESNGVFNIASGNSISMLKLAQIITKKFDNKYEFLGIDENEGDKWKISIKKAKDQLNFNPLYSSEDSIMKLLNSIKL